MSAPADTSSALGALTSGTMHSDSTAALSTAVVPASPASLAVNVASVKTHVPVVLDLKASNYSKWRMLMGVLLDKYDLTGHVAHNTPAAKRTAEWNRQDFVVRSWLYGSISEEILDIIMGENQTAYEAYVLIRNLFLDNQMTRAVYLEAEFRAITQGDLSITAYCHRLKSLSDALRDVGQPVTDQTLVLNCLRGLNPRFADITTLVTMQVPVPTFLQTRSLLLLRETQLAHTFQPSPQVALYGNNTGSGSSSGGDQGGRSSGGGGGGNGRGWRKKNKNGGGGDRSGNADLRDTRSVVSPGPWICFNPHTGQAQQMQPNWRPTSGPSLPSGGPGLLGPRPTGPSQQRQPTWVPPGQQAYVTQLAPLHGQAFGTNAPPPATPYLPYGSGDHTISAPAWDCSALVAALNNTASSSNAGGWVMDSGATSHMVSDPATPL
ncbi:uncharacterized protein [Lolium perenne]|uniref:uncharacterized protein n=1 Tax=Lolium perenne TaxID=4522 RepID=UPI0021F56E28|nr:uncharacterized protein LOC127328776 [Lolium perenne]